MPMRCKISAATLVLIVFVLGRVRAQSHVPDVVISKLDTVVTTESGAIELAMDLAIAPDGSVLLSDVNANHLLVIPAMGAPLRTIGRKGRGPGEFTSPQSLVVHGDTVEVLDWGNVRRVTLSLSGKFLGAEPMSPRVISPGPTSLQTNHLVIGPTMGRDSSLAVLFKGTMAVRNIGVAIAPARPDVIMMSQTAEQMRRGDIPGWMRNHVRPVLAGDGSCWLVLVTEGIVQRYDRLGKLEWTTMLEEPQFPVITRELLRWNHDSAGNGRFKTLWLVSDAQMDGDGLILWINTPNGTPASLVALDRAGRIMGRIHVPSIRGSGRIGVDRAHGTLWLLDAQESRLLRAPLPAFLARGS